MKIISWNVNGFRSAVSKYALDDLVTAHDPDMIFLQEMKCTEQQALDTKRVYGNKLDGYMFHIDGSTIPGRHGVAMFIKEDLIYDESERNILNWLENVDPYVDGQPEARLQVFVLKGILFVNTYSVNVRPDLSRVPQRAEYDDAIYKILDMWKEQGGDKAIVLGDFNVVSELVDYHGPAISTSMAGMTESERSSFKTLLSGHNLRDSFRELHPDEVKYSYWSYRGYARETNKGWRIDYALVTDAVMPLVESADILTNIKGSDHAPILLELKDLDQ